jgi:hypothetical protein
MGTNNDDDDDNKPSRKGNRKKKEEKSKTKKKKKEQETTLASAQLFIAVKVWRRERSANTRRQGWLIPKVSHEASTTSSLEND